MVYTLDELQSVVAPIAEQYGLKAVYVFGSYARGEAREDSDIDLLVDTTGTQLRGLFALGGLYNDLAEALKKKIDMVTVCALEEPRHMQSDLYFRDNVYRERREIYAVA